MFYNTPLLHLRKIVVRESNFQGKRLEKGCLKHSLNTTFWGKFVIVLFCSLPAPDPLPPEKNRTYSRPCLLLFIVLMCGEVISLVIEWKLLSLDQLKKDNWLF